MADKFAGYSDHPANPPSFGKSVTPSDTADLPAAHDGQTIPKGIYVGTGGTLVLVGAGAPDNAAGLTFKNVPSGSLIPFRARRVLATGTTATDILALY